MKKLFSALLVTSMITPAAFALEVKGLTADLDYISFVNDKGDANARDIYVELGTQSSSARKQTNRRPVEQKISLARENTDIRIATGNIDVIWSKIPKWLTADLDLKADNLKLKLG